MQASETLKLFHWWYLLLTGIGISLALLPIHFMCNILHINICIRRPVLPLFYSVISRYALFLDNKNVDQFVEKRPEKKKKICITCSCEQFIGVHFQDSISFRTALLGEVISRLTFISSNRTTLNFWRLKFM